MAYSCNCWSTEPALVPRTYGREQSRCEGSSYQHSPSPMITSKRRGGSDPDTADELIQPEKLDTFTADTAFFDLFWGKDTSTLDRGRGQWQGIHPHKLVYAIKSLQRGANAATMVNIPAARLCTWGAGWLAGNRLFIQKQRRGY